MQTILDSYRSEHAVKLIAVARQYCTWLKDSWEALLPRFQVVCSYRHGIVLVHAT